jgi:hypothetical protein
MTIPKKFFHDRLILLLVSINGFLALLTILTVLFKIDSGRGASYIVQYRSSLGLSALRSGEVGEIIAFIAFAVMVIVVHGVLAIRTYTIKREVSVTILAFGVLLLLLALIVSNALLGLR